MGRRPTIADLAEAAGVSVATVDRVLNARHPVREATAERVLPDRSGRGALALHRHRRAPTLARPRPRFWRKIRRGLAG